MITIQSQKQNDIGFLYGFDYALRKMEILIHSTENIHDIEKAVSRNLRKIEKQIDQLLSIRD